MGFEQPEQTVTVGRRKRAVARVYLRPGSGEILVNRIPIDKYFKRASAVMRILQPLQLTKQSESWDILVNVRGGGKSGQADAVKHGISRALQTVKPELRPDLKAAGFLRRDARQVERKKYGQPGARKRFQFSKR